MDSNKPTTPSDEIDINQLFRSIGNGFKNFGQAILNGIASLRRMFLDFFAYFIIVIGFSLTLCCVYYFSVRKTHYTSSMIISCKYLNMRIMENAMDKLNLLCSEPGREGLAEVLAIDVTIARNVRNFTAENFVSENDRVEIEVLKTQLNNVAADKKELVNKIIGKIEIGNAEAFKINVSVFNPDVVQALDSALVRFFRNNEYINKRIEANRLSLLERRRKLIAESKKLDSLKSVLFVNFQLIAKQSRDGSGNVVLSDKYLTDPIDVFKEDLNLNNEMRDIDKLLAVNPDFEIVDGLTTFREPSSLNLTTIILIALALSIVLGYVSIGIWKFNKYLSTIG